DSVQLSSWETSVVIWTAAVMAYVLLSPDDSLPSRTSFWQSVSARVSSAHY
ncbi:MAG: hypothetical protein RLZZ09_2430, partial [Pseudomonadota bacterium]